LIESSLGHEIAHGSDNNIVGMDPLLAPLADYGGPTQTHALLPGSPAIDKGIANGFATDQRGKARTIDDPDTTPNASDGTDIGAFEYDPDSPTVIVDTALDVVDGNTSSILTLLAMRGADNVISLREAIIAANNTPGADEIDFDPALNGIPISLGLVGMGDDSAEDGDLDIADDLTIQGNGGTETIIDGNGALTGERVFHVLGGTVAIDGVKITGGRASWQGGGIYKYSGTLSVSDCTISGNTAVHYAGGIGNNYGHVSVLNSTISENDAGSGGGLYNWYGTVDVLDSTISGNDAVDGGGIGNYDGTVSVARSTISGNYASWDGGGVWSRYGDVSVSSSTISGNTAHRGGGIYSWYSNVSFSNSTISGNVASSLGGGIRTLDGTLSVSNSTISGNAASWGEGGGIYSYGPIVNLSSTIIADNTDDGTAPDLGGGGTISTPVFNLIESGTGHTITNGFDNNIVGLDPLLAPLADYGGPTETHALLPGSPAIDQGTANGLTTDQRGEPRSVDDTAIADASDSTDMGAYEYDPDHPVIVVDTDGDVVDGNTSSAANLIATRGSDNAISLREAVIATNNTAGADYVRFDATLDGRPVTLSLSGTGDDVASDGDLDVTESLTIIGNGQTNTIIDGNGAVTGERVFDVLSGTVTFDGVRITGGFSPGESGGAIRNQGTLTLQNSTISGNTADVGGGISSLDGTVFIQSSTVFGNTALVSAGGIANHNGTLSVSDSIISGNVAESHWRWHWQHQRFRHRHRVGIRQHHLGQRGLRLRWRWHWQHQLRRHRLGICFR